MEQYCLNNSHCECCVHLLSMTTDRSVIQHYSCHWFPPSLPLSYSEHHSRVHNMPRTLYNTHISVHPLLSLVVLHVVLYELGRYICSIILLVLLSPGGYWGLCRWSWVGRERGHISSLSVIYHCPQSSWNGAILSKQLSLWMLCTCTFYDNRQKCDPTLQLPLISSKPSIEL